MFETLKVTLQSVAGVVLATSHSGQQRTLSLGDRQIYGVDQPLPMNPDTSFDLGSITKIIATTSALMALAHEEKYSLEDKVAKYIPAWSSSEKSIVTLKHLLLHRAGLWEWQPLYIEDQNPNNVHTRIASMPLRYGVDQGRHYSDLGFLTLGKILTIISGNSLDKTVEELVSNPLKMYSTRFSHPISRENVAATSWGDSIEREMVRSKTPYPIPQSESEFGNWRKEILCGEVNDGNAFHLFQGGSSHAGLFSTASDLVIFGEEILRSLRGEGYFAQEIVKLFLTVGPDSHQTLGFRSWSDTVDGCTDEFYGHTGFPGTVFAISPKHDFVATLLTNRLHVKNPPVPTEDIWRPVLSELHRSIHS